MLRIGLFLSHSTTLVAAALLLSPAASAQTRPSATSATPVTAQPVASQPAADECIPACRAGYVCARGQCVSSCNPPCASNEVCTSTGQCVATAPAAAAAPAAGQPMAPGAQPGVGAGAAPVGASPMALATPEPPPPERPQAEIRTFSFVPRLGIQGGGSVNYEYKCDGSCTGFTGTSLDFDLKSAFLFGADFMFKVGDLFRLGPGLLHTLSSDVSRNGTSVEAGSITELNFVAEVIPRVGPGVWLVPRVQTGLGFFSASGFVKNNMINPSKDACAQDQANLTGVNVNCSNYDNPHIGLNIGLGFGAMFAVSPSIRLRADAMYEYFDFTIGKEELSAGGQEATLVDKISGSRYLFMAGMEI